MILIHNIQSNLPYVTLQGNSEMWSHKEGCHLIQVNLPYVTIQGNSEMWSHKAGCHLIQG